MVYTSSPALISHLKAAAPIRLIEGGVISPKNLGSGSGGNGHRGDITKGESSVMESSTSTGMDEGITVVTLGEIGAGTREETEDETSHGPDGVLIGCEAAAPT